MRKYLPFMIALWLSTPSLAASPGITQLQNTIQSFQKATQEKNWTDAETQINRAIKILRQADSSADADFFLDPDYQKTRLLAENSFREFQNTMAAKAYYEAVAGIDKLKKADDAGLREMTLRNCQDALKRLNTLKRYGFDINTEMQTLSGGKVSGLDIQNFCQEQLKTLTEKEGPQ